MARRPRLELPGVPLHVIQRGNNRSACFVGDGDRRLYLRCLREAARRHTCAVHAYVLMSNHVHLLVTPSSIGAVAATMQDVGRRYVRLFNQIHGRSGTLWEGRYKSSLIDSERYLLTCHRYIELNPVRAGLVNHPLEYAWSSHAHYALGATSSLITRHVLFDQLAGGPDGFSAQFRDEFKPEMLERIRTSANRGWALGSEGFLDQIEVLLGRSARPPKRGRPFKSKDREDAPQPEMLI
ncbi:MAG: transposase [Burkholderiales bacterium]